MNASSFVLAAVTVAACPAFAGAAKSDAAARAFQAFSRCDEATMPDLSAAYAPPAPQLRSTTAANGTTTVALEPPLRVGGVMLTAFSDSRTDLGELGRAHEWGFASPQPPQVARAGLLAYIANGRDLVAKRGFARVEYFAGERWVTARKPAANGRAIPDEAFGAPMRVFEIHGDDGLSGAPTRILCHATSKGQRDAKPRRASLN